MKAKITIAKNSENIPKHISEVTNGIKCNCVCIDCGEALVAANNGKIQEHHFRHHTEAKCDGIPESALHLLAKRIITESNKIRIGKEEYFEYQESNIEKLIEDIQPDIQIIGKDEITWLIEIAVTHFVDEQKLNKIKSRKLNCLEIDLKDVDRHINLKDLSDIVLEKLEVRKILCTSKESEVNNSSKKQDNSGLILIIGVIIVFLIGIRLKKKKRQLVNRSSFGTQC